MSGAVGGSTVLSLFGGSVCVWSIVLWCGDGGGGAGDGAGVVFCNMAKSSLPNT